MANPFPTFLVEQFERRAAAERKGGAEVEINPSIPTVAITLSDGSEFFFQEREASELLNEIPDNLSASDYLLATAQNW